MSELLKRQLVFTENLAKLINFINFYGFRCKVTEVFRTPAQADIYARQGKGIRNSQHCKNLAADIYLFQTDKKNDYQYTITYMVEDYKRFGEYWKSLNKDNRWGGDFQRRDAVHFEMRD